MAKCPFCDYEAYVRRATTSSPDHLRDLKRHITHAAKNEALLWYVENTLPVQIPPHLGYYKKHTSNKRIVMSEKRVFDNDMSI